MDKELIKLRKAPNQSAIFCIIKDTLYIDIENIAQISKSHKQEKISAV